MSEPLSGRALFAVRSRGRLASRRCRALTAQCLHCPAKHLRTGQRVLANLRATRGPAIQARERVAWAGRARCGTARAAAEREQCAARRQALQSNSASPIGIITGGLHPHGTSNYFHGLASPPET